MLPSPRWTKPKRPLTKLSKRFAEGGYRPQPDSAALQCRDVEVTTASPAPSTATMPNPYTAAGPFAFGEDAMAGDPVDGFGASLPCLGLEQGSNKALAGAPTARVHHRMEAL